MNPIFEAAKKFHQQGYAPIPVNLQKRPKLESWAPFQKKDITPEELARWEPLFTDGLAILTGAKFGLIVVDVDKDSGGFESARSLHLPPTKTVRTGGGGVHYYY